ERAAMLAMDIGSLGWVLFAAFFFWFILAFTGHDPMASPVANTYLVLMSMNLVWRQAVHHDIISSLVPVPYGWGYTYKNGFWNFAFYAHYTVVLAASMAVLFRFARKTPDLILKRLARVMILLTLSTFALASVTNTILPSMGYLGIPAVANVLTLFWAASLVYAIARYRFMALSPATAASNILATMNDALILFDSRGRVAEANEAAAALAGTDGAGIRERAVHDLFRDLPGDGHFFSRVLAGAQVRNHETSLCAVGERQVPVLVSASLLTEKGLATGVVCAARDITQMKEARRALTESEELHKGILSSMSEGIFTLDREFKVLLWNRAMRDITGVAASRAKSLGRQPWEIFPDLASRGVEKLLARAMAGETVHASMSYPRTDGEIRRTLETYRPLRSPEGEIRGIVGVVRDVTRQEAEEKERKRLEAQLNAAKRLEAIGTLAGGTAHNFNNLLMGIGGNAALARLEIGPGHPAQERLRNVEKLVASGSALTGQILGYASQGLFGKTTTGLNLLVLETCETFCSTISGIEVTLDLDDGLYEIEADPGQIEQVLLNLYVNAAEAMPRGGALTIRTRNATHREMVGRPWEPRAGAYARLTVTDTGVGMDSEALSRIFEPCFTTKGLSRGTGLGLASSYGIIKGHRGYIHAESQKGAGTTFTIHLPAAGQGGLKRERTREPALDSGKILVVDDDQSILETTSGMLSRLGYSVLCANTVGRALSLLEGSPEVDLILMDLILPDMPVAEAFSQIRKSHIRTRVILTSGYSLDGRAREILDMGCDGFLEKPFTVDQLGEKIREALGS
ncbi:MAG: PAS domain-containing protein, partial [Pseudomonadota bacterium]